MNTEKLFEDNQKLVYFCINRYFPLFAHDEDAEQEGMIGLWKASQNYDKSKAAFSTFAVRCIVNQIRMWLKKRPPATLSLDAPISADDDIPLTLADVLDDPAAAVEGAGLLLADFIDRLDTRGKMVVALRLQGLSQYDMSARVGLSQSYICRLLRAMKSAYLEDRAVGKVR